MLLLGSAFDVGGLTVLRDHVSHTTFHYLPGPPRLVSSGGRPGVQLLRYRGGGTDVGNPDTPAAGGGLLTLDVHLGHDARVIDEARDALTQRVGAPVSLVPVTFGEGHVRLAMLGVDSLRSTSETDPRPTRGESDAGRTDVEAAGGASTSNVLVERVLATTTPSLFGDARAIFSVTLSAEGATLIEQALRAGTLPVVLVYDLAYDGLRLARGIRASVDYRMAYDFLRAKASVNALVFKSGIDAEAEALRREQLIAIEDVDYTGTDPAVLASRAEEIKTTLRELVQALFYRPAASPAALPAQMLAAQPAIDRAWGGADRVHAAFVLRDLAQEETGRLEYDFTTTRVARQTIAPQGSLATLDGFDADAVIRDIDLTEPRPRDVRLVVPAGADWTGVGAVEVVLRPAAGGVEISDVVRPDRLETTMRAPAGEIAYATRVFVRPEPDALGTPADVTTPFAPLPADTIVIDPVSLAGRRTLTLSLSTADATSRVRGTGRLTLVGEEEPTSGASTPTSTMDGGGAETSRTTSRAFVLDAQRPSVTVPIRGREPVRLSAVVEIDDVIVSTEDRELASSERIVVLSAPTDRVRHVVVELLDPLERFESVFVEIEGVPDGIREQVRVDAAAPRQEWTVVLPASDGPRGYRYRVRKIFENAQSVELSWQDGVGQLLVVGDTDIRVAPIDIVLLGAPADTIAMELTVTSLAPPPDVPAATSLVIEQTTRTTVAVPFAAAAPIRYRVEGRIFTASGDEHLIGPHEDTGEVCLVKVG